MIYLCQCPLRAILISTAYEVVDEAIEKGVNALGGLFSFLPASPETAELVRYIVSMPSAGYSHFYPLVVQLGSLLYKTVSMPSAGYSHFYLIKVNPCVGFKLRFLKKTETGVSMPSAGYSHFYGIGPMMSAYIYSRCQCPRRAILISTEDGYDTSSNRFVSMPSAGYSHFYSCIDLNHCEHWLQVCQCPRRAILISTAKIIKKGPVR